MARRRILVLDVLTPTPDQDSGSFITLRMMKAFQELGFQITFVPQHNYSYAEAYAAALQRTGIECLYAPYFVNMSDVLNFRDDFDFVLAYRHNILGAVYDEIRSRMPASRIVFHNVDLHYLREQREAQLLRSAFKLMMAEKTKVSELRMMSEADCVIVHTPDENQLIQDELAIAHIMEFPYIAEVRSSAAAFEDRHDIMFLGGFAHTPNIDAVKFFVAEVWPKIMERLPADVRFLIVGAAPPAEVRAIASERIVVTGYVPELTGYFDQARIFVAPLRYGAGIKGKVIQSLAHGVPVVITDMAAEGVGLVAGEHAVVESEPAAMAAAIVELYSDRERWHAMQAAGYDFVREKFSWERGLERCAAALDIADRTWRRRHGEKIVRSVKLP